jgi:peptidyl-prolyl cis-trans isomerase SurA
MSTIINMRPARLAIAVLAVLFAVQGAAGAVEVIDRILAVVSGEVIMLSDARAAARFDLIEVPATADDPIRVAMNALVDRHLQLLEVNRYLPPEPPAAAIDEQLAAIRGRFQTDDAFRTALAECGINEAQLRARVRDNLRIASYRGQRFAAALQPSDEDLLRYYRSRESEFTKEGTPVPFAQVRDQVRERLAAERSQALIREWLETLRRRAEVQILYQ